MNIAYESVIGNQALKAKLCRAIEESSLSHAYILEGSKGSGRHTIVRRTAAALCCKNRHLADYPCGKCSSCVKILGDRSPDVITVGLEDERATIGVDAIRFLKNDIYIAPTDGDHKIYIIEDADKLTSQAQNAFLLSLEEPPPYVLFFLICENSSGLLETVKSRAPILRTEKISAECMRDHLVTQPRAQELDSATLDEIVTAARGSIGYALELLDPKRRKPVMENRRIAKEFILLASGKRASDKLDMLLSLGNKRAEVCERIEYIQYALRDLILLKQHEDAPLCFYSDREDASELSTRFTAKRLFTMFSATEIALDDLSKNSNVKLTLMNMLRAAELI